MGKRKLQIFVIACLLGSGLLLLFYSFDEPKTDKERYQRMVESRPSFSKLVATEKGTWGPLVRPLHLSDRYIKKFESYREALLATGYLTNMAMTVSNAQQCRLELVIRLDKATQGSDAIVCGFAVRSNLVSVTCRVEDVARFRHALED